MSAVDGTLNGFENEVVTAWDKKAGKPYSSFCKSLHVNSEPAAPMVESSLWLMQMRGTFVLAAELFFVRL